MVNWWGGVSGGSGVPSKYTFAFLPLPVYPLIDLSDGAPRPGWDVMDSALVRLSIRGYITYILLPAEDDP